MSSDALHAMRLNGGPIVQNCLMYRTNNELTTAEIAGNSSCRRWDVDKLAAEQF